MTDDSTIPAEPLECRPRPDPPDQADNLWRPRRRLALRTARPPRLLIRFRNPCRRDRRRTFGWYVRFTSVPPCAGPTHSRRCTRNEWVPRAGSSGRVPRGPSRPVVRTGDRTQLDRLTLRGHDGRHNRVAGAVGNAAATCASADFHTRVQWHVKIEEIMQEAAQIDFCLRHAPDRAARLPATTNTAGPSNSRPA